MSTIRNIKWYYVTEVMKKIVQIIIVSQSVVTYFISVIYSYTYLVMCVYIQLSNLLQYLPYEYPYLKRASDNIRSLIHILDKFLSVKC